MKSKSRIRYRSFLGSHLFAVAFHAAVALVFFVLLNVRAPSSANAVWWTFAVLSAAQLAISVGGLWPILQTANNACITADG